MLNRKGVVILMAGSILWGCSCDTKKQKESVMKTPIVDRLENYEKYVALHPAFAKAFAFLRQNDMTKIEQTKHIIDGDKLFCSVATSQGRKREEGLLEAHRKYIDIQYVISGKEEMGFKPVAECKQVKEAYSAEKDIAFYSDAPATWIPVPPGSFIIFFPEDGHAPLIGEGDILKAVVKVAVE